MEVITGGPVSTLNPNAPLFVPMAFRAVEDFSDQWWDLVKSNPWFRDYWLRECFQQEAETLDFSAFMDDEDGESAFLEIGEILEGCQKKGEENEKGKGRELVSRGSDKWNGMRSRRMIPAKAEKVPKIVKMKLSPRTIQQPR